MLCESITSCVRCALFKKEVNTKTCLARVWGQVKVGTWRAAEQVRAVDHGGCCLDLLLLTLDQGAVFGDFLRHREVCC